MALTIYHPVGFNETGGRSNNEDSIYPPPGHAGASDRLFLVCDGVGGEHKGEVASALACETIGSFFAADKQGDVSEEQVGLAVKAAHEAFKELEENDPETKGMATTMTLLYLLEDSAVLAHLGDSRIYHIRDGHIIYHTRDHKWVNELVESGVITEEQAREHPKRNVITRVITASRLDEPDYILLTDIRADDYFFLCTDGVLEQMYDELLEYHLRDNPDNHPEPGDILEAIRTECAEKTRDNFSAYLIRIQSAGTTAPQPATIPDQQPEASLPGIEKPVFVSQNMSLPTADPPQKPRGIVFALSAFAVVFCAMLVLYFFKNKNANDELVRELVQKTDSTSTINTTTTLDSGKIIQDKP